MSVPTIPNPNNRKAMPIVDLDGGAEYLLPVTITTNNAIDTGDNLAVGGLQLTTAGVSDSTDKNFVTDAELADLATITAAGLADVSTELTAIGGLTGAEVLLSSTASVDFNAASETTLYTVPAGKSCIITRVVIRAASASLTTASVSFGFNAGTDNDVIADSAYTALTGATKYSVVSAKAGSTRGAAADVFAVNVNTPEGSAATATIDTFGYLY